MADNFENFINEIQADDTDNRPAERLRDAIRSVVSSRQGRHLVWAILQQSGIHALSYTGEANSTAFNEGQRNIGIWLKSNIDRFAPEAFMIMTKEAKEDLEYDNRTDRDAVAG